MNEGRNCDIRELFSGLDRKIKIYNGDLVTGINFDNAATTPPLKAVIKKIEKFSEYYGSVGRGSGYRSYITTKIYNDSRGEILKFFGAKDPSIYDVMYTKNTTEGLNVLAYNLLNSKDEIVLTTRMEHHSNDLPWRFSKGTTKYVDVDKNGRLNLEDLERKLRLNRGKVKIVSITGASNVTGYTNDINFIGALVHKYGAKFVVDGAQLVPHKRVILNNNIDFLVFSSHKLYAPYGIGVVIYKKRLLNNKEPMIKGGGTILYVGDKDVIWANSPAINEGGTPNVLGVVGLVETLNIIKNKIGFEYMESHEEALKEYLLKGLKDINNVTVYSDSKKFNKVAIGTFNINGIYHEEVSRILSARRAISVRSGCFCAHPYIRRLLNMNEKEASAFTKVKNMKKPGMVRASLAIYNNEEEIDEFLNVVDMIANNKI